MHTWKVCIKDDEYRPRVYLFRPTVLLVFGEQNISLCLLTFACRCVRACACACVRVCACVRARMCMHMCVGVRVMCMCLCSHARLRSRMCVCICVRASVVVCARGYVYASVRVLQWFQKYSHAETYNILLHTIFFKILLLLYKNKLLITAARLWLVKTRTEPWTTGHVRHWPSQVDRRPQEQIWRRRPLTECSHWLMSN